MVPPKDVTKEPHLWMVDQLAPLDTTSEGGLVRPLSGGRDEFVSPTAVLHRLHLADGPRPKKRVRSDEETRTALALAMVVGELVQADEIRSGEADASVVQARRSDLAQRTGASVAAIEKGLEALSQAEVLHVGQSRGEVVRLRLFSEVFAELPGLSRLSWEIARERIVREGGSLMPALAVLREIGRDTGPWPVEEPAPWTRLFYPRLMETTFYGRTALAQALACLEAAGLLERGEPVQRQPTCRLSRIALGLDLELPLVLPPHQPAPPVPTALPAPPQAPAQAGGGRITVQLGSTRIRLPEGAECDIDWDESGEPVLQITPPTR